MITYDDMKLVLDGFGKGEDDITPTEFDAYGRIREEFRSVIPEAGVGIVWAVIQVPAYVVVPESPPAP